MHKCIYLDFLLIRKRPVPNTKEHLQFGELRNLASGNSPSTFQCIVKFWGVKSNYYRNLYIIGDQGDQICSGHGYAPLPSASVYKCMDGALVFTLHLQGMKMAGLQCFVASVALFALPTFGTHFHYAPLCNFNFLIPREFDVHKVC